MTLLTRIGLSLLIGVLLVAAGPVKKTAVLVGQIRDAEVTEASGLAGSLKKPGVFWTHNDSGNLARLYAMDASGEAMGRVDLDVFNIDWEDIAIAGDGTMFIADTGNNSRNRKIVTVYALPEPDLPEQGESRPPMLTPAQAYRLRFPGKAQDFEAVFATASHVYLLSKQWGGGTSMYRFARADETVARGTAVIERTLEKVCDLKVAAAVTAASLSASGKRLAIQTVLGPAVYDMPEDPADLAKLTPTVLVYPDGTAEACAWEADEKSLLLATERRKVLRFTADTMTK